MNSALAKVAARQAGVFSRRQALTFGYRDNQISRATRSGAWIVSSPGVYRLAGAPTTLSARGWLVVLSAGDGALLSHRVAGWLHQIDAVPGYRKLDVSVPAHRRPRDVPGAVVHRAALSRADAAWSRGLPVTSALRTVVDQFNTTHFGVAMLGKPSLTDMPFADSVPFGIRLVVSGPQPFIVLDNGNKLLVGGTYMRYRLIAVEPTRLVFDGPRPAIVLR